MKLKVENTIRWREIFDREGNVLKESNCKLVKWSDGSMSMHLGKEIFDVYKQPLQVYKHITVLKIPIKQTFFNKKFLVNGWKNLSVSR